jgi:hypothetical protein
MTVAELIEILRECDPQSQVAFVEGEIVTQIGFIEQKVGNSEGDSADLSEVFLYEEEPHWPDFDLYQIKLLATNDGRTFAKNVYIKLPED